MAKRLLIAVYPGLADWEVGFPIFCLRPKIEHTFAAVGAARITTALGFDLQVSLRIEDARVAEFDGLYLPGAVESGGGRFPRELCENANLTRAAREFSREGKILAALCGAPLVLGAAGLLKGKRFASNITEDTRGWFDGATRVEGSLAVDGNILTASVQATLPFSVELARLLGEEETARTIQEFFTL